VTKQASRTAQRDDEMTAPSPVPGITRPVFLLGIVSFFTDISSEMIYPLAPSFLTAVVGAPVAAVGIIEGVAESTASFSKLLSGWLSDRLHLRKPLVILGYSLSAVGKPFLAIATVWPVALAARFTDRLGKGIRTAPRDALLAEASDKMHRGRAFGFHRAADSAGAVIGPLIGLGLFELLSHHYRPVFLIAFVPAVLGVIALTLVPERRRAAAASPAALDDTTPPTKLGHQFYVFLAISMLFAFGNSSDAFLILRSEDLGLTTTATVLAYVVYNFVYTSASFPAGVASDKVGRRAIIVPGFLIFAFVYLGFAVVSEKWLVFPLFLVYGLYIALTDAVGKAWVIDFAPSDAKGTAVGLYTSATGAMVLVSSIVAGVLWDEVSPSAPFVLGATTAAISAVLILVLLGTPTGKPRNAS
jgi:MFS family permease